MAANEKKPAETAKGAAKGEPTRADVETKPLGTGPVDVTPPVRLAEEDVEEHPFARARDASEVPDGDVEGDLARRSGMNAAARDEFLERRRAERAAAAMDDRQRAILNKQAEAELRGERVPQPTNAEAATVWPEPARVPYDAPMRGHPVTGLETVAAQERLADAALPPGVPRTGMTHATAAPVPEPGYTTTRFGAKETEPRTAAITARAISAQAETLDTLEDGRRRLARLDSDKQVAQRENDRARVDEINREIQLTQERMTRVALAGEMTRVAAGGAALQDVQAMTHTALAAMFERVGRMQRADAPVVVHRTTAREETVFDRPARYRIEGLVDDRPAVAYVPIELYDATQNNNPARFALISAALIESVGQREPAPAAP